MARRRGFFYELQRRHVVRVAIAYAVVAWVLLQLASIAFPSFGAPDWVMKVFMTFIVLGFPVALTLAWALEMTPEGIRRTKPAGAPDARSEEQTRRVGRQLNTVITVVLALVVALLLLDRFFFARRELAPAAAVPAKSIAVLPFENLSSDANNAYFAGGMQEEILTRLAAIHDLQVVSRTSTAKYASHPPDLKTVGRQLGVATLLEGSVQKAGNAVHINVQLIDAASDHHLWAKSYDRKLEDIFAVEGEVAQNIADALQAHLSPQESARVGAAPTSNAAAYDLYLQGLAHYNRAYDQTGLTATEMPQAVLLLERALAVDPRFAMADALLSGAHMRIYFFAPDRSQARLEAAKAAADRALALQSDLGEGHLALARFHYYGHRDYIEAGRELHLARQLLPNNAEVELTSGALARRQMRWNEAIGAFKKAIAIDPRSALPIDELGRTYENLRRYADADREFGLAMVIAPNEGDPRFSRARNLALWKGDLGPMRGVLAAAQPDAGPFAAYLFYRLHWLSRDYPAAIQDAVSSTKDNWTEINSIVFPRTLFLAWAHEAAGDDAPAHDGYRGLQAAASTSLAQRPDSADLHMALAFANAGLGLKDEALREGLRAAELLSPDRDALSGTAMLVWLAQLDVRVGHHDAAFMHLRQVLALPSGFAISPALLRLDPVWDPIRDDPRFAQVLTLGEGPVAIATEP